MALLIGAPALRADTMSYTAIVKEREAVLVKIVATIESRHGAVGADDDALSAAKLALYSFRRDTAQTPNEKLQHQEQIVALYKKKLAAQKALAGSGTADPLDVLRVTDAALAAKQLLAELKAVTKQG